MPQQEDHGRPQPGRAVLDATAAAYYLGMTEAALRRLVQSRIIPFRQRGRVIMFVVRDLDRWLEALPGCSPREAVEALGRMPTSTPRHITVDLSPASLPAPEIPVPLVRGPQRPKIPCPGDGRTQG